MTRLRHMLEISPSFNEVNVSDPSMEVTFAPMDSIRDGLGGLDATIRKPLSDVRSGSYNYFRSGDFLLAKVTPCFENGKKALAGDLANGMGFATSEVHILRPDPEKLWAPFLLYLMSSEDFRAEGMKSMTGAGGLRRVAEAAILNYRPVITDLLTQKRIADFLDRETSRIDQLIEKKMKLNEILKEKRSAMISAAVSGPAEFAEKAEGDWLPIKYAANFYNGAAFKPSDWGLSGLPIIRIAQLTGKPFDNYFEGDINRGIIIRDGDLLFSWSATIDAFIWSRGDAILNQHIFKVVPKGNAYGSYLYYLIKSHAPSWADVDAHGSTMRHIKKESLSNKVWLPDLERQMAIANHLDCVTKRIDSICEKNLQSIEALKEYRSALITAAVTGQIDVTTYQPKEAH